MFLFCLIIFLNLKLLSCKNFLINFINNDNFAVNLNENEILTINFDRDLDYKQKSDIIIKANNSLTNKKLIITINFLNQNNEIENLYFTSKCVKKKVKPKCNCNNFGCVIIILIKNKLSFV